MNIHNILARARSRARLALSSARGAFDLPSIITGVVVVGILTAGVFAAVFGVIPFAQDRGAKQDLGAVRTAEGVSKAKDSKYTDAAGLHAAGYLPAVTNLAVGADSSGSCWVGLAKSGSGSVYYSTTAITEPQIFTSGTDTGCLSGAEQAALAESLGVEATAAPQESDAAVSVAVWGDNWTGEFGNGRSGDWAPAPIEVFADGVFAGKTISLMAADSGYACAVADGDLYCWGDNYHGQIGNGTQGNEYSEPTLVAGPVSGKTVTALSAGYTHACAVADGDLYCWGANSYGGLGDGSTTGSSTPVLVTGALAGKTVTSVAAGMQFTCAVTDGSVYCWGLNNTGKLGNGSTTNSSVPVLATGALAGKTVTNLAEGSVHTCAIAAGAAYCWGSNLYGQLGNGTTTGASVPVAVTGVPAEKTVTAIEVTGSSSCAMADGSVYCWGANDRGQLGNGGTTSSSVPVQTTGALTGKTATSLAGGMGYMCAVADSGAYCWGSGAQGQLGDGNMANSTQPVQATGVLAGKTVTKLVAGGYHAFAMYR